MSYLLSTLRSATPERHQLAVRGLRDGTYNVTIACRTESEIRALVRNGDGHEYGVNLSDRGNFCSCKAALYRGTTCKHQLALAVHVLQQNELPPLGPVHLLSHSGAILCGSTNARRLWQNWPAHAVSTPDVCQTCIRAWLNPGSKEG